MNTASYLGASLCPRGRFAGSRSSRREGGIGRARRSAGPHHTLSRHGDLPLWLCNVCLHLEDYFIAWYLSSLRSVESEGRAWCFL